MQVRWSEPGSLLFSGLYATWWSAIGQFFLKKKNQTKNKKNSNKKFT